MGKIDKIVMITKTIKHTVILVSAEMMIPVTLERIQPVVAIPAKKTSTAPTIIRRADVPMPSSLIGTVFNSVEAANGVRTRSVNTKTPP